MVDVKSDITHHTLMRPSINPKGRISRIYTPQALSLGQTIELEATAAKHLVTVLRHGAGDRVALFNGDGRVYMGTLLSPAKAKGLKISIEDVDTPSVESSIDIHLVQAIGRGERMDWAIQKATELGVMKITPMMTERVSVKLDQKRTDGRLDRWQAIAIHAAEQSGRTQVPIIEPPLTLQAWSIPKDQPCWYLDPMAQKSFHDCSATQACTLIIGPEGGLSSKEVTHLSDQGAVGLRLGPRILRTETAGAVAIAAIQTLWGDFR